MKLNYDIVIDYIAGNKIDKYKNCWFFNTEGLCFKEPSYNEKHRKSVEKLLNEVRHCIENFIPCNVEIWNELFGNWKAILDDVNINLIVGYPEPFDATVLKAPDNKMNVVLDLGVWTKYENKTNISDLVHNLLTHELCHICIGKLINSIDDDLESDNYHTQMDAISFHEGFAHLVAFDNKNIDEVNWESEEWQKVKQKSKEIMKLALCETKQEKQKKYLHDAFCGSYKEKFACMCGMFYLVDCWHDKGIEGIKNEFKLGYEDFAKRCI
ncbi:MAG: hypothetical protein PUE01_14755 [Clostridiaceae bacterium]|nr:hypothetical protein [Clostridiaceae bacterium]